ncbi:hypothetical protein BGX38DRAFT_154661 [Terfezia claveryi]|nr:hypothetical protein BGX38DRAFT_154661 [Terfezia claveryi]
MGCMTERNQLGWGLCYFTFVLFCFGDAVLVLVCNLVLYIVYFYPCSIWYCGCWLTIGVPAVVERGTSTVYIHAYILLELSKENIVSQERQFAWKLSEEPEFEFNETVHPYLPTSALNVIYSTLHACTVRNQRHGTEVKNLWGGKVQGMGVTMGPGLVEV